ncbi:MAG: DUF2252 family protein [Bacteroidetes bacterium]|nr:DUF2252 family protein [Bacteroidota bacterium]MBS1974116.1 DUF2252 family protein [Bacteroidota bacterium]
MPNIPERVKAFNKERLPQFTALKYKMMAQSAFRFFRGTCHLFYEDLAKATGFPGSPPVWVCGDLHLENFGSYKGDNRLEYFDLNDFDEAALAPALWEVARMAASILVGFDDLNIPVAEARDAVAFFLKKYSGVLATGKPRYIETGTAKGIVKSFLEKVALRKQKELLRQRAVEKNGKMVLLIDNIHFYKLEKDLKNELIAFVESCLQSDKKYKNSLKILDAAFRIAGTGSVGVKRYAFLAEKLQTPGKYILADMKQAMPSSLQPFSLVLQPNWLSQADRVVAVQQRMQNVSPALLSSVRFKNDDFVLKELQPVSDKIHFEAIKDRLKNLQRVIEDMAMLTASAQLRSTGRQGSTTADDLIHFGGNGDWQKKVLAYAGDYAAQVKTDYSEFAKAYQQKYFS